MDKKNSIFYIELYFCYSHVILMKCSPISSESILISANDFSESRFYINRSTASIYYESFLFWLKFNFFNI